MFQYIYLIQEREFIKTNEPIYKIGRTKQENLKRICNYPNGTRLIIQMECVNCDDIEKELICLFKKKYELQKDIGNEYFKGNCIEMRRDICNCVDKQNAIHNKSINQVTIQATISSKTKVQKINYTIYKCPRCGYETKHKNFMRNHFYNLQKPCKGVINPMELTHEIKEHILVNSIWHPPPINTTNVLDTNKT